jgi:uncharacterized protein YacL
VYVEGVRLFVVVLATAAGFLAGQHFGIGSEGVGGMLGCLLGYVSGGLFGRFLDRALGVVERKVETTSPAEFISGTLGAIAGGLLAIVLFLPLALLIPVRFAVPVTGLGAWFMGWLGYRVLSHQSIAVLESLGISTRPLVRAHAFDARDGLLVDTSVLMDGQLIALARAGVVSGDLMVARFVLDELQGFADSPDDTRRRRARRGLESLEVLERDGVSRVFILDDEVVEHDAVDAKLVALAKRLQLRLLTNDGPLARSAELQGVPTCNLRRLAQELSPAIVVGDFVKVALTKPGKEAGQGVGHLEDGSMVVVNGGSDLVGGPDVMLQVTSVVPTNAGRLVFARLDDD